MQAVLPHPGHSTLRGTGGLDPIPGDIPVTATSLQGGDRAQALQLSHRVKIFIKTLFFLQKPPQLARHVYSASRLPGSPELCPHCASSRAWAGGALPKAWQMWCCLQGSALLGFPWGEDPVPCPCPRSAAPALQQLSPLCLLSPSRSQESRHPLSAKTRRPTLRCQKTGNSKAAAHSSKGCSVIACTPGLPWPFPPPCHECDFGGLCLPHHSGLAVTQTTVLVLGTALSSH